LSDTSGRPTPGPFTLVLRAAFVPDGEVPPPEFLADFSPLKFRATLDRTTGIITCDNAGINFGGDIRAEWHPDEGQGSDGGEEPSGQDGDARGTGGSDDAALDRQIDRTRESRNRISGSSWPMRTDGRVAFGLAGNGSREKHWGASQSPPAAVHRQQAQEDLLGPTEQPLAEAAAPPKPVPQQTDGPNVCGYVGSDPLNRPIPTDRSPGQEPASQSGCRPGVAPGR
jgi:hypothetical protein